MSKNAGADGKSLRRRNPEATRKTILAAARTVLASDGPDGLSMSRVAHLAGVNRGTAYQHFETREALIKATVEWVSEHLAKSVKNTQTKLGELSERDESPFYEMIAGVGDFAIKNPELGRIWLFEILASERPEEDVFFRQFKSAAEDLAKSDVSQDDIDTEVFSVMLLAGYFLWPTWTGARAKNGAQRRAISHRMRKEMLRSWLFGTLRPNAFPELAQLLHGDDGSISS